MFNKLPFNYPILSVRQPYAYQIIHNGKDVENRNWRPKPLYFGPLYIHAARTFDSIEDEKNFLIDYAPDNQIGGVIGLVRVVAYKRPHQYQSRWANMDSKWLWILEDPQPISFVQMNGRLGLFYG